MAQQLVVVVLGSIPDDLRHDLGSLDPEVVLRDRPEETDPKALLEDRPQLLVLGEHAALSARELRASSDPEEEPLPILALRSDPDADLCFGGVLGRTGMLQLALRLARLRRALSSRAAAHDSTEPARALFQKRLEYEFARALRYRHSVSLVTLSVDGRDRLVSVHGNDALEELMATLEETLRRGLRDVDLLFRSAQEEIAAILPETPVRGAALVADRFLAQTSRLVFKPATPALRPALPLKTTSSIGVADGPQEGVSSSAELLLRARECMGSARATGGGKVSIHGT